MKMYVVSCSHNFSYFSKSKTLSCYITADSHYQQQRVGLDLCSNLYWTLKLLGLGPVIMVNISELHSDKLILESKAAIYNLIFHSRHQRSHFQTVIRMKQPPGCSHHSYSIIYSIIWYLYINIYYIYSDSTKRKESL